MWNIHVYTASSAGARCAMLGGGGIGEQEASAVTGGGGIEEQVTAVFGGGGIGEHVASTVTGPAGSGSTRPARSPAAAVLRNSPAPYLVAAGYLIPNGPDGEPGPTRLRLHRTPYPYSAADGPSGHCPGGQKPLSSHTGPFPPRAPLRPPPGAAPHRQPGTVDSGAFSGPAGRRVGRPARRHRRASRTGRGRSHRQPRQLIERSVRWREEPAFHADPRTTMRYDWARTSLDRHATYIVATYIAGAAR